MSEDASIHQTKNEIIIVRRRHDGEHEAHGGAWKIAYADFMTAMMAFFLVMWLINAANEETKAAVASYFNPIKLTDDNPSEKGLKEQGNSQSGEQSAPKSAIPGESGSSGEAANKGEQESTTVGEKTQYSEADYFKDPYAVLAEIVQETGTNTNVSEAGDGGAANSGPATGATGGEAYRDPFDPDFWSKQVEADKEAIAESEIALREQIAAEAQAKAEQERAAQEQAALAASEEGKDGDAAVPSPDALQAAGALKKEIEDALQGISAGRLSDALTVVPAEGGLLVSLTDQLNSEMFRVGSAVPEKSLVLALEKIGEILSKRKGEIDIRGYTDARPFSNGTDDNWRLSMERAHSAYFMLVRGGVPEDRIVELSGFADRKLKDADNPFSEVNRRIEILLQVDGG
ncbi:MotB family protein [Pseudohoeflea suaedae]|uniref:MotB family protein n=1 Tax=Pseudohoeflea suaedae TaxID=877384 RepID=A0A4R5PMN1_9HYPH|nr:MotB family protein [Pseudohoeflea suaedae]TDH38274.1 MotB family protein [Pseudohoeflea suaedae]